MQKNAALTRYFFEFPECLSAWVRARIEFEKDLWRIGNQSERVSELWRILALLLVTVAAAQWF